MSIKSWKKEFYSKPAYKCCRKNAIEHSLTKWQGLLKKNLEKHDLVLINDRYFDMDDYTGIMSKRNSIFKIDGGNCALCVWYLKNDCTECPLYKILGCDCDCQHIQNNPYFIFRNTGNPMPMINALKKAKKLQDTNK
jgi:hypothetical protein